MNDKDFRGKLVYLTVHVDKWLRESNPQFNIPMACRYALVTKVFDWDTDEGKLLLAARAKTKKWGTYNPKDFKYVLRVYHPDLLKDNKLGISVEEVLPRYYPGTELPMFNVVPENILKELREEARLSDPFLLVRKSMTVKKVSGKKVSGKKDSMKTIHKKNKKKVSLSKIPGRKLAMR